MSSVRIIVDEDFAPFRQFISETLPQRAICRSSAKCSDGLEAVQKAVELRPDLILLDIGLPNLNGIEAARQIRELVPESKIIFWTQESSADVMREARKLGTWGYVVKTNAANDLLPAVEAVISGKQFFGNT